jgi:hypothetical protein
VRGRRVGGAFGGVLEAHLEARWMRIWRRFGGAFGGALETLMNVQVCTINARV